MHVFYTKNTSPVFVLLWRSIGVESSAFPTLELTFPDNFGTGLLTLKCSFHVVRNNLNFALFLDLKKLLIQ